MLESIICDIGFILKLVSNGEFLTNHVKYKLVDSHLDVGRADLEQVKATFSHIFGQEHIGEAP